jgi:acetyl-CoA decarbonylase/synthase, CODH/ACS complex subunit delta
MTVASADPRIPMAGIPIHPKIRKGLRIALRAVPRSMNRLAPRESPIEIRMPFPIMGRAMNMAPRYNNVLPRCSQAAAGERCLIGTVKEDNYKTLVASCLADGHTIIGLSPIDINIAKQVNILVSEMGLPLNRIVMYPTTGALGYGIEYAHSIQERGRLAALGGDKIMSLPVICMVGGEAWRTKEAKGSLQENPAWGDEATRGVYWEIGTASSLLQAGSDILVMRHPAAVAAIKKTIGELMVK